MKKLIYIPLLFLFFISCKSDDTNSSNTYCWKFVVTTHCTGVSQNQVVTTTQCNLTEAQAEDIRKSLESSATAEGITCTTTAAKGKTQ